MSASAFARLADSLETDWVAQARPEQLPPPGNTWTTWIFLGGRGAGKTLAASQWVRSLAEAGSVGRIGLVAPTWADGRDTMIEGVSGLLSIAPNSFRPVFEPSKRRLTWPNGVQASLFASEEPERLRGPQHGLVWGDEISVWKNIQATWDNLQFGLRMGKRPRQVLTTTPRPLKLLRELVARDGADVVVTRGSTYRNRHNLAPSFFSQIVRQYEGTRIGRQELDAEILEDIEGALWGVDLIERTRIRPGDVPQLTRIVVAVDPSVSSGKNADETGIIVCGLGVDGHGYVLEDASGRMSPIDWARRAVGLYRKHGADRIVAEVNNGGDLVEMTIRTCEKNVSYKAVRASRGKLTRAEPIAALFEQNRIHLVGGFPELEDELCTYTAGSSGSPGRLDSATWALTDLMLSPGRSTGMLDYWAELSAGAAGGGGETFVKMLAPANVGSARLLSGRNVAVPADRAVEMTESDAAPLEAAGWIRAPA